MRIASIPWLVHDELIAAGVYLEGDAPSEHVLKDAGAEGGGARGLAP